MLRRTDQWNGLSVLPSWGGSSLIYPSLALSYVLFLGILCWTGIW
jgi:hypothetical protein